MKSATLHPGCRFAIKRSFGLSCAMVIFLLHVKITPNGVSF